MRVDASAAKTWLYAAIAGWAVLVWALSLFGMGGRINHLQDDPSQRHPLPAMPAATWRACTDPANVSRNACL